MKKQVSEKLLKELNKKSLQLMENSEFEKARKILDKLLDLDPKNPNVFYNYALTYFNLDEYFEAYNLFNNLFCTEISDELRCDVKEMMSISKSNYIARKAYDFIKMEESEIAIPLLKKALNLYNENNEAYFYLGIAYQNIYEFNKAVECYEKLLHIDENFEFQLELKFSLGKCYLKLNNIIKAQENFAFILMNDDLNKYPQIHFYFGDITFRKNEYKKALQHINNFKNTMDSKTNETNSEDRDYYDNMTKYYRAMISIYDVMGNIKKSIQFAKKYFNSVINEKISLDPECVFAAFGTLELYGEWDYIKFLDKKNILNGFGNFGFLPMDLYAKAIIADKNCESEIALDYFVQIKEYICNACDAPGAPNFNETWKSLYQKIDDYNDFNIPNSEPPFGLFVDSKIKKLQKQIN